MGFINFVPHQNVMIKSMKFKWEGRAENGTKFWSVELKGICRFVRRYFRFNNNIIKMSCKPNACCSVEGQW